MSKKAITKFELNPLMQNRWSPRAFDERPVELDKLYSIFEAARWSPSASNIQPWIYFIGLKSDHTYQKIVESLVEFNQMWAVNAPVLILNCGKTTRDDEGNINPTWQYDLGQSVAHLSLQAMEHEIYIHQMSGFDVLKAAELFQLPEDVQAVSVSALGYMGDPGMLHPRMQKSEIAGRSRKEMDTFVFSENFGTKSPMID